MKSLTDPGQAATLLGAVAKSLDLKQRIEATWWTKAWPGIHTAPACDTTVLSAGSEGESTITQAIA